MKSYWQTKIYQGLIPGPTETTAAFEERSSYLLQHIDNEQFKNSLTLVERHFGMRPSWISCRYSAEGLAPFELAAAFIDEKNCPVIHLHPRLRGKKRFLFYNVEEIIAHEMVHAMRAAFNEPRFEEYLASRVFASPSRRFFGSLLEKPSDAYLILLPPVLLYFAYRFLKKRHAYKRLSHPCPLALTDQEICQGKAEAQGPRAAFLLHFKS